MKSFAAESPSITVRFWPSITIFLAIVIPFKNAESISLSKKYIPLSVINSVGIPLLIWLFKSVNECFSIDLTLIDMELSDELYVSSPSYFTLIVYNPGVS